jgi:hypothetical protein
MIIIHDMKTLPSFRARRGAERETMAPLRFSGVPIKQFTEFMLHRNIAVGRRFPPFENWCRVTIGADPQIDAFIEGVRAFRASPAKVA